MLQDFRFYATREKGMKYKSYKAIESSVKDLHTFHKQLDFTIFQTSLIRIYLQERSIEKGWSPKTYANYRQCLASFYHWLLLTDQVESNPVDKISKPKLPDRIPRSLTKEDANKIITGVRWVKWLNDWQTLRNETIVSTFLFTGIRLSELLKLEVKDIRMDENYILIREGKMSKDRLVPIHPQLRPILESYLTKRANRSQQSKYVFTGLNSPMRLYSKDIYRIFKRITKRTKVKCTPHMLRHTFGRLAVEAELGLFKIKEIMGHTSVSTTQIYLSVSAKNLNESFQKIDLL